MKAGTDAGRMPAKSARMLERAAQKAPDATLHLADMRELPSLWSFDLITCMSALDADALYVHSAGNPFFVTETLAVCRTVAVLETAGVGRCRAASPGPDRCSAKPATREPGRCSRSAPSPAPAPALDARTPLLTVGAITASTLSPTSRSGGAAVAQGDPPADAQSS
jgi:hypothetical protein